MGDTAGMALRVHNITFDCRDAMAQARFWSEVLGWHVFYDDDPEVLVAPRFPHEGPGLLFIPVPEDKVVKNRVHLDLEPETGTRDEAVDRAVALGAAVVGDFRQPEGGGWVTLADPEGNELCIERSAAERGAASRAYRIST